MNTQRVMAKWIEANLKFAKAKANNDPFTFEPHLSDYPELMKPLWLRELAEAQGRKARGEEA